jgi:hypothetical protein
MHTAGWSLEVKHLRKYSALHFSPLEAPCVVSGSSQDFLEGHAADIRICPNRYRTTPDSLLRIPELLTPPLIPRGQGIFRTVMRRKASIQPKLGEPKSLPHSHTTPGPRPGSTECEWPPEAWSVWYPNQLSVDAADTVVSPVGLQGWTKPVPRSRILDF